MGESVSGYLDFSLKALTCHQVSVFLESTEIIDATHQIKKQNTKLSTRLYSELHLNCNSTKRLEFSLYIPKTASPDFQTSAGKFKNSYY